MNAIFNDMQDHLNPLDGVRIHESKELFALLGSLRHRDPFVAELVGDNGYKLTLGIGPEFGFVQYSPSDGDVPYLVAVAREAHCEPACLTFLCGNTPTPIPRRNCLPFGIVKAIAAYFIETGHRSPELAWEEV